MASARPEPDIKPQARRSDAYTGMLLLSLLVLIAGCVLIYLDFSKYPTTKPQKPPTVSAISNPEGGAPAGGQPGAPKGPPAKGAK